MPVFAGFLATVRRYHDVSILSKREIRCIQVSAMLENREFSKKLILVKRNEIGRFKVILLEPEV